MTMPRLLRFSAMNVGDSPSSDSRIDVRCGSPAGDSILMTSAPMSPRIMVQNGPARNCVRSRTRRPSSGRVISPPAREIAVPSRPYGAPSTAGYGPPHRSRRATLNPGPNGALLRSLGAAVDFTELMTLEALGDDTFVAPSPRYPWGGIYGG